MHYDLVPPNLNTPGGRLPVVSDSDLPKHGRLKQHSRLSSDSGGQKSERGLPGRASGQTVFLPKASHLLAGVSPGFPLQDPEFNHTCQVPFNLGGDILTDSRIRAQVSLGVGELFCSPLPHSGFGKHLHLWFPLSRD